MWLAALPVLWGYFLINAFPIVQLRGPPLPPGGGGGGGGGGAQENPFMGESFVKTSHRINIKIGYKKYCREIFPGWLLVSQAVACFSGKFGNG